MRIARAISELVDGNILAAVVGLLGLYVAITTIREYLRLRHIPGPPGAGWSKWWIARHQMRGTMCCDLEEVADKYGPIARVGPDWVVVSDPTEIRRIWSVHSGYQRSPWYKGFRLDPHRDSILTANENKEHYRIRSKVLPGYGGKGLGNQEVPVDEAIVNFVSLINREYVTTNGQLRPKPMDGYRVFQYFSQDANSAIEFGKPFGYLEKNSDFNGIMEAVEILMPATSVLALFPSILWLVKTPLVKPFLPQPTDKEGVGRLLGLVQGLVQERYREKESPETAKARPRDVLQSFVESALSPDEVQSEALVHLLGGSDTTAATLRTTIFYLAAKPTAYRTLQAEIDKFMKSGKATRPVITDAEAKSLPYLQAVIKEGLRIWPPITGLMAKVSPKDDIICGKKVPAGTHVAWAPLAVMRNKQLFGQDAQLFEPGRWIATAEEAENAKGDEKLAAVARLKEMEAVQNMAFAMGSRWECLGRRLALTSLGKVLFELFLRFDFAIANPVKPFEWANHGFTLYDNMNFVVTKREAAV
ncbi:cytochrome P450 family protein [Rhypophila decipiens]|uniref:Cytochrome P450 family protein n=1 Tax=Rhypophila decipiens TaxID=261697 RepID=A0AAN6XUW2_9PEZI|nr:cytochrome P450 family protein [Rhypophila decipiens]